MEFLLHPHKKQTKKWKFHKSSRQFQTGTITRPYKAEGKTKNPEMNATSGIKIASVGVGHQPLFWEIRKQDNATHFISPPGSPPSHFTLQFVWSFCILCALFSPISLFRLHFICNGRHGIMLEASWVNKDIWQQLSFLVT